MSDTIDCIVAGAGVVGLAIGRRLALAGLEVAVLDKEDRIGSHTSSRNSEVIHAGIYYATNSLKAKLCVAGKHALYEYCDKKAVPHKRIGKLIVATQAAEESTLEKIRIKAAENGVTDLVPMNQTAVRDLEPNV
ncbi:MAG: FAD-dependent oxidoreductase, partial [Planctomycetota bacterium]